MPIARAIAAVRIEGAKSWSPEQIAARLKTRAGQLYNAGNVSDDLKELGRIMRTAKADTQTSAGALVVVYTVTAKYTPVIALPLVGSPCRPRCTRRTCARANDDC